MENWERSYVLRREGILLKLISRRSSLGVLGVVFRCEGARNREGVNNFLFPSGDLRMTFEEEFYTVFNGYAVLVKYESILRDGRFFIVGDITMVAGVTMERLSLEGYDFRGARGDGTFDDVPERLFVNTVADSFLFSFRRMRRRVLRSHMVDIDGDMEVMSVIGGEEED